MSEVPLATQWLGSIDPLIHKLTLKALPGREFASAGELYQAVRKHNAKENHHAPNN